MTYHRTVDFHSGTQACCSSSLANSVDSDSNNHFLSSNTVPNSHKDSDCNDLVRSVNKLMITIEVITGID